MAPVIASSRVDNIRTGENATPPPPAPAKALRPAFVPKITPNVNVSDQFTMDYTDLPVDNSSTVVKYFLAPGVLSVDAGVTLVTPVAFDGIEQLAIKANPGAVDVTANLFNAAYRLRSCRLSCKRLAAGKMTVSRFWAPLARTISRSVMWSMTAGWAAPNSN